MAEAKEIMAFPEVVQMASELSIAGAAMCHESSIPHSPSETFWATMATAYYVAWHFNTYCTAPCR